VLPIERFLIDETVPVSGLGINGILNTPFQALNTEVRTLYLRASTLALCKHRNRPTIVRIPHVTREAKRFVDQLLWKPIIGGRWLTFCVSRELKLGRHLGGGDRRRLGRGRGAHNRGCEAQETTDFVNLCGGRTRQSLQQGTHLKGRNRRGGCSKGIHSLL
jgi:hypothetical protein